MMFRSKARNSKVGKPGVLNHGFTMIEMVVVISLILVLLSIALPMYNQSILRAKEAKLHQNLTTLNKVIQEYSLDKKHAPQALEDLVPGYIKFIPEDITGRTDTWKLDQEEAQDASWEFTAVPTTWRATEPPIRPGRTNRSRQRP
jgi:prepilin-type N-terminal cleavage/methylation domain-containing protein